MQTQESTKAPTAIERFPQELLQHIFDFTISEEAGNLASICLVCSYWRTSVMSHPVLWTHEVPALRIPKDTAAADLVNSKLRLCIARSGSLPLSLHISFTWMDWQDRSDLVLAAVPLVIDQCHRWMTISLTLPIEAWEPVLSKVRGNVPLLTSFKLKLSHPWMARPPRIKYPTFDYFADAPSLHDVSIDTRGSSPRTRATRISILPSHGLSSRPSLVGFRVALSTETFSPDPIPS
ncbi:hypothetical protein NMY22_g16304 [Coprinellus aureogranulatus]|nr:hypothetical protein NMY22_g16304 [Coprinellus aureogranulatus]